MSGSMSNCGIPYSAFAVHCAHLCFSSSMVDKCGLVDVKAAREHQGISVVVVLTIRYAKNRNT